MVFEKLLKYNNWYLKTNKETFADGVWKIKKVK